MLPQSQRAWLCGTCRPKPAHVLLKCWEEVIPAAISQRPWGSLLPDDAPSYMNLTQLLCTQTPTMVSLLYSLGNEETIATGWTN